MTGLRIAFILIVLTFPHVMRGGCSTVKADGTRLRIVIRVSSVAAFASDVAFLEASVASFEAVVAALHLSVAELEASVAF